MQNILNNMIFTEKNIERLKQKIKGAKHPVIVLAQDDSFNRRILESGKIDILLSPERNQKQQNLRQMDSGFNQVLAKIASKKEISVGLDLKEISGLSKEQKAKRISKIIQNIKIFRKNKVKLAVSPLNVQTKSFLLSIGASTQQIKEAVGF